MSRPTWPTKTEYDVAMQAVDETVHDEEIRRGRLAQNDLGVVHYGGASLYTCLYRVDDWMVRCFCSNPPQEPPDDIAERYECIARFYHDNQGNISALLPTYYIDPGIDVPLRDDDGRIIALRTFPLVKMRFLKAPKLGDFIADHYQEKSTMDALSRAWLRMASELEDARMAHGDLDLTNVLVAQQGTNLVLKLIDYDNVWIPALGDGKFKQTEHGHPSFQHPAYSPPNDRPYDAQMDRFAALVMYISLKAIAVHPELYRKFGADDAHQLLLSANDFRKEYIKSRTEHSQLSESHIKQLYSVGIDEIIPYLDALRSSLSTGYMPARLDSLTSPQAQAQSQHSLPVFLSWGNDIDNSQSRVEPQLSPQQQSQHSLPVFLSWGDEVDSEPSRGQPEVPQPEPISSGSNLPEVEASVPPSRIQPIWPQPEQRSPITEPEINAPVSRVPAEPPQSKETIRFSRQELEAPLPRTQVSQQSQRAAPVFNRQDSAGAGAPQSEQPAAQPWPILSPIQQPAVGPNIPIENLPTQAGSSHSSVADANAPTQPQIISPQVYSLGPLGNIPPAPVNADPIPASPPGFREQQGQVEAFDQDAQNFPGREDNEAREVLIGAIFFVILFLVIAAIIAFLLWRFGILHLSMIFPAADLPARGSTQQTAVLQAILCLFPVQYSCLPPGLRRHLR